MTPEQLEDYRLALRQSPMFVLSKQWRTQKEINDRRVRMMWQRNSVIRDKDDVIQLPKCDGTVGL